MSEVPPLEHLLEQHRDALLQFVRRQGGGLAAFEAPDDLVQGIHMHALRVRDHFTYEGDAAFIGWIRAVARQFIAGRYAYWNALKRNAGPMLRVTYGGAPTGGAAGVALPAEGRGPVTRADAQEQESLAARAMDMLPERDQRLIELLCEDAGIDTCAQSLGISPAAAQRARLRARERFRKVFELLLTQGG